MVTCTLQEDLGSESDGVATYGQHQLDYEQSNHAVILQSLSDVSYDMLGDPFSMRCCSLNKSYKPEHVGSISALSAR